MPTRKYLTPEVLHDSPLQDRRTADFHFDDFSATLVHLIPWHFTEAAANLLTNDALDPQVKIPEFKTCAV